MIFTFYSSLPHDNAYTDSCAAFVDKAVSLPKRIDISMDKELRKKYLSIKNDFDRSKAYYRYSNNTYDAHAKCILCKKRHPTTVFYPCAHKCVCDKCLKKQNIGPYDETLASNEMSVWR